MYEMIILILYIQFDSSELVLLESGLSSASTSFYGNDIVVLINDARCG